MFPLTEYNVAMICEKGHVISTNVEGKITQRFCKNCSAPTITACRSCKEPIQGSVKDRYGYLIKYHRPAFCHFCGKPYPWTLRVLSKIDSLNAEHTSDTNFLKDVLTDMVFETPTSKTSALRFKNYLEKLSPVVSTILLNATSDLVSDGMRELLGLL